MTALMIQTEVTETGKNAYNFESRGTSYTVIDDQDGFYTVFSERKSASFGLQIAVLSLKELKARSKALNNLAAMITA